MPKLDKVLITGSSKGLGKSLAKYFFEKGHEIILHGTEEKTLKKIKLSMSSDSSIDYYACDLNNYQEILGLSEYAKSKKTNLLINNAGMHCANKDFLDLNINYINKIIDINLKAPILLTHSMIAFLNGIININSMSGIETKKLRSLYASTKWGLKGFSGCLKKEYDKINILDVYPSSIKTNSTIINGMEISYVVDSIYNNYYKNINELILDGRKENV